MKSNLKNCLKTVIFFFLVIFLSSCSKLGCQNNLYAVRQGGAWRYVSPSGKYLINPQFRAAYPFTNGLALVCNDERKYGFIDPDGKFVIPCQFTFACLFLDDYAIVVKETSAPLLIDTKGNIVLELKNYSAVRPFSEGLLAVQKEDKWGFLDKTGGVVINPQFDECGIFSEGLAPVRKDGRWGFINTKGELAINYQFYQTGGFNNGRAIVRLENKVGAIDKEGKYIINPQFEVLLNYSEGFHAFRLGRSWGFANEDGKIEIDPRFDDACNFSDGLAAVSNGNLWGYIDKKGKMKIDYQFSQAGNFVNGRAIVRTGSTYGIIGKDGKYVVNPQFDDLRFAEYHKSDFALDCIESRDYLTPREAMLSDMMKIVEEAKAYLTKDQSLGGGGGSFNGINLPQSFLDTPIGSYSISPQYYTGALVIQGSWKGRNATISFELLPNGQLTSYQAYGCFSDLQAPISIGVSSMPATQPTTWNRYN